MTPQSVVEALAANAAAAPEQTALVIGRELYTYAQLWDGIRRAAACLTERSVGQLLMLPTAKTFPVICFYFGAHLAGVTTLPVDPHITQDSAVALAGRVPVTSVLSDKLQLNGIPALPPVLPETAPAAAVTFPGGETVADIMFTTGTTGQPKCVPLTHKNLLAAARNINTFIGNNAGDKEVIALPLCHSFGMGRLRCTLIAGGTAVILPNFGNERKVLRTLSDGEVTGFAMVPAAFQYLKHLCGERLTEAAAHLRYIEFGSAPLPLADKEWLMQRLPNTRLCMHYGLTEASRSCFIEFHAEQSRLNTVGKASPNTEIAVFSAEGQRLPIGETGEVCIKGQHVIDRYLNVPTADSFYAGFFRTGDMGYLDAEGYLHLAGRLKEIINTGGKKVSPDEVEEWINLYPGVKESACIAAPDPEGILGEVVKACIVWEGVPDEEGLCHYLREHLEQHKIPRLFHAMEQPLPRTESGKLQRQKLA